LALEDVVVNPFSALAGELQFLEVGRVTLEAARVDVVDLQAVLHARGASADVTVVTEGDALLVRRHRPWPAVSVRVRAVEAEDRPLALVFEEVRIGGVRIPDPLVRWVSPHLDPTRRMQARFGFAARVNAVTIADGVVRVGPPRPERAGR
jgi:hypothetical protein